MADGCAACVGRKQGIEPVSARGTTPMNAAMDELEGVIAAFRARLAARGEASDEARHDTHISAVLLAGDHAFKFKKPVDFGFVDFTTLDRRRHFCEREVELNRRFAPTLYEGVETITADDGSTPVEYAVRMRRFARSATLDRLVLANAVAADEIGAFADGLAAFHRTLPPQLPSSPYGQAGLACAQILATVAAPLSAHLAPQFAAEVAAEVERLHDVLAARHASGHVRDCHGDLHLSNIVRFDGRLVAFDCIEFNDELRIIDTLSDAAFLLMDLDHYAASQLGNVFFNRYLEASDAYDGLAVLPLYLAYRSLIRAKVAVLGKAADAHARAVTHVALAQRYLRPRGRPGLVITHGLSGSGKSHAARRLANGPGFLHLRSDIERRRLGGLAPTAPSHSELDGGIYTAAHGRATYARLAELARCALTAGFSVIVDAAFLTRAQRAPFRLLARTQGVPFHVLGCSAPRPLLEQRIVDRHRAGDDPSEATLAVLAAQCEAVEELDEDEMAALVSPASLDDTGTLARLGRARPGAG